ncbi:uncharacterized protein LOC110177945 [Drosophila serrata]|uniref:uncharacterized protein LOC110177945 n=1 Tax=Drosophila serrata TaxID=7274 RepID=UPI000A1CFB8F|nr:uncharacterized protein LOC110177945 [Drosophila serrata]
MSKSWSIHSLINQPDLLKKPSSSGLINFLARPMSIELDTAYQVYIGSRRQRMKQLLEKERAWEAAELARLGLSCIRAPDCYPCCTSYECAKLRL